MNVLGLINGLYNLSSEELIYTLSYMYYFFPFPHFPSTPFSWSTIPRGPVSHLVWCVCYHISTMEQME
jgi:hypothetical protein